MIFLIVVTVLLALLNLTGIWAISWWIVLAPLYPLAALTVYFLIYPKKQSTELVHKPTYVDKEHVSAQTIANAKDELDLT
jgi:LPS O-antigen subunit length determinant protein (WzzB/FepE family)